MHRALPVVLAFVLGIAAGAVATGFLLPAAAGIGGAEEAPPYSYSTGTSPDVDAILAADRGWLHEIHVKDRIAVTGNATVVHDAAVRIELDVTRTGQGEYRFAFVERPAETSDKSADGDVATTIDWGVDLPEDYERYVITVDGTVVKTVSNDDVTTARLLDLPHPLG